MKLVLAGLLAIAACGDDSSTPAPCDLCIADPDSRCIRMDSCEHDRDCPRGTSCSGNRCIAVQSRALANNTARDGFNPNRVINVGDMFIELNAEGTGVHWVAPNASVVSVKCGLYVCQADVVDRGPRNSGQLAGDGLVIDNYEKCVYLESSTASLRTGGDGVFDLLDSARNRVPARIGRADACRATGLAVGTQWITDLGVICLAFDATQIVAVSSFLPVDPTKLAAVKPPASSVAIPTSDTCRNDREQCYDAANDRFGTCFAGLCQRRCADDSSCAETTRCSLMPDELVGVCVPK